MVNLKSFDITAIGFVASVGTIDDSIAASSAVDALAGSATEFTRPALCSRQKDNGRQEITLKHDRNNQNHLRTSDAEYIST